MRDSKHPDLTRRDLLIVGAVSAMATGASGLAHAETFAAKSIGSSLMSEEPTNARKSFGDIAPHLAEITDQVLFGDVWANTTLSPRDRSLVTITSLISLYRINELPFHLKKALENGITKDEIIETITQLAFYAGWPPTMTALQIVRKELDA